MTLAVRMAMASVLNLDDDTAAMLAAEARRQGLEPADLAREAIQAYLSSRRRLLGFSALGESGSGFRAAGADEVLKAEFGVPRS